MKLIKSLSVIACLFALTVGSSLAEDKKTCCEKAKAEGKECTHKCCVAAKKEGKTCEKCNPKKDDKKDESK
ncbi:MAG: hypothetical protein M3Y82_03835 [Verrucomicrobiota bacterium]|nr:hypothetical protein [Verrucomicrobiota bacterium]